MKSKEILKEVVLDTYNKDDNYTKILQAVPKKRNHKKRALILIPLTVALVLAITLINQKPSNTEKEDNYFLTTIYADDEAYNLEDGVTIHWDEGVMDEDNLFYEFPYYLDTEETMSDGLGGIYKLNRVYSRGMKINLRIEGENVEKVIYTINDTKGNALLYRAVSGELSDISFLSDDEEFYTNKDASDYRIKDRQTILDTNGDTDKKAEDYTDEEFDEYLYQMNKKRVNNPEKYYHQDSQFSKSDDIENFWWDVTNRGTEIEILESQQGEDYALFLTKILENINDFETSMDFQEPLSNPDYYYGSVLSPDGLAKAISEETSINIQIVYKNGVVHEKTLTFNLIEQKAIHKNYVDDREYEVNETTLQGVLK
ncbi:MAG: hypothetical protein ACK5LC_06880 [Coprobacillaceae bacterium]